MTINEIFSIPKLELTHIPPENGSNSHPRNCVVHFTKSSVYRDFGKVSTNHSLVPIQ